MIRIMGIILCVFMTSCVGSPEPRNPLTREGASPWWQASTVGVGAGNPWNKFVAAPTAVDRSDPWANFQEPDLFPENWNKTPLDEDDSRPMMNETNEEIY